MASARRRTMERPSPVPPKRRVVELSACTKGWNRRLCCSSVRPMPVSATLMRSAWPPAVSSDSRTDPVSVNLMALPRRLNRICCRRSGSPVTRSGTPARDIGGELEALGGGLRRQRLGHALDQLDGGELDAFEVEAARLDLGEVEDVVDDPQQRRRRIAHRAQRLALLDRERRALQHVDHAQHAVHRRADLVAHGGEEGRLGLVGASRRRAARRCAESRANRASS